MGSSLVQICEKFGYACEVGSIRQCYNSQNDCAHSQREVENTLLAVGSELLAVKSHTSMGGQLQVHSKPQIERC